MMKVPKFEKKHLIAGGVLAIVALTAFAFGARQIVSQPTVSETHSESDRKPAAVPAEKESTTPDDDHRYEEEELDVQVAASSAKVKEDRRGTFTKLVDTYSNAIESVNEKVQSIQRAEEENRKLKLENAYLRVMAESQKYACRSEDAKKKTETIGQKLAHSTGSKAARSLASIRYHQPENLLPEQLHALGVSYFKVKDDEKAAIILNYLTELEDDKSFKTAANYLMAGISFYRLESYKNAKEYFEKIGNLTEVDAETQKAKRQASYWKALVAERMKDSRTAQKLILENLEKNPHTNEARWVNPVGESPKKIGRTGSVRTEERSPASEETSEKESHENKESHH